MAENWQNNLRSYISWKNSVQRNILVKKSNSQDSKNVQNEKDLLEILSKDAKDIQNYLQSDEKYFSSIQHPESKEVTLGISFSN